jgi:hypothetical protein
VVERVANHRRAIDAAVAAGVSLVAYTSMSHVDTAIWQTPGTSLYMRGAKWPMTNCARASRP